MKAVVYHRYGPPDVLRHEEVDDPPVGDETVLVRVRAAAANPYDWHFMRGVPYAMRLVSGLRRPKEERMGVDFSGQVEAVGNAVTRLRAGDEVFGMARGAFAEYLGLSEADVALKPGNLTFEQAAAVPLAGLTALQSLRDGGRLQPGQRVLIVGASGGVGTFAVQIAKRMRGHVTGVCSTRSLELVRSLGADEVVDYTRVDFTDGAERYDLVLLLGGSDSVSRCRRVLSRDGTLVLVSGDADGRWLGPLTRILAALVLSPFVSQTLHSILTRRSKADLEYLASLVEEGEIVPVIDRTYSFADAAEAIRYLEQGHPRGKVVITM